MMARDPFVRYTIEPDGRTFGVLPDGTEVDVDPWKIIDHGEDPQLRDVMSLALATVVVEEVFDDDGRSL